jgi:hypothetical protein
LTGVICRYVQSDLATVDLDLNGVGDTWTGKGFALLGDPDLGPVNLQLALLRQQGVDGAILASASHDTTVMTLPLAVRATTKVSIDEVVGLWRDLAFRVSAGGGFLEWQLPGESESRFFEPFPSGVENLIGGGKDTVRNVAGGAFDVGHTVAILLQPFGRLAKRLASVQLLTNASLLRDSNLDGRPDGVTYSAVTGIIAESISNPQLAYALTRNSAVSIDLRLPTVATTVGQTRAGSVYAASNVSGIARVQPVLQWLDGGGLVLSETVGTLTPLGPVASPDDRPRLTVSGTAPASSATVRFVLRLNNASASAVIAYLAQAQVESGLTATAWRLGAETNGTAVGVTSRLLHNPGNVPALVKLSVDPTAGNVVQLRAHLRSFNRPKGKLSNITDWLNSVAPGFELESTTLSTGTASVAVGAASGGNVAQTTFTAPAADDQGVLVQCWQKALTNGATTLEGAFYAYAVVSTSGSAKHRIQVRYTAQGAAIPGTMTYSLDPVTYDTSNIAAGDRTQYSLVNLGVVRVDPGRGDNGLVLQGWASLETAGSTSKLNWDCLFLLPCDELSALYTEPTFISGGSLADEWAGFQLITPTDPAGRAAGSVVGQQMVLNAINEAAGTPPAAGFKPVAGRHTVSAKDVSLFEKDLVSTALSELVVRIVGAPGTTIKTLNLWSKKGLPWSPPSRGDTIVFDVPGDAATTDFIEYYVNEIAATVAGGRQTNVKKLTHSVVLSAVGGSSQPIVIDAIERAAYVTGANPISAPQGFIYAPPGYSVLTLIALDRNNMGFESVYSGPFGPETMAAFVAARTYTTTPDSVPRVKPL